MENRILDFISYNILPFLIGCYTGYLLSTHKSKKELKHREHIKRIVENQLIDMVVKSQIGKPVKWKKLDPPFNDIECTYNPETGQWLYRKPYKTRDEDEQNQI